MSKRKKAPETEQEYRDRIRAEVRAERIAQGLPPTIEDPGFYRRWADFMLQTEAEEAARSGQDSNPHTAG